MVLRKLNDTKYEHDTVGTKPSLAFHEMDMPNIFLVLTLVYVRSTKIHKIPCLLCYYTWQVHSS